MSIKGRYISAIVAIVLCEAGVISKAENVTRSGYFCQRWDSQSPHKHTFNNDFMFPDATVSDAENYCRNPDDNVNGSWCYTTDPRVRRDFCDEIDKTPTYKRRTFPYSTCEQTTAGVFCENLNMAKVKAMKEEVSLWPPGPFAVLRSQTGECPESKSHGWRKGIMELKTYSNEPRSKLYFCTKIRNNPEVDAGEWIWGSFRIFKVGEACPKGFVELRKQSLMMFNGYVSHVGYVPQYERKNNTGATSILFNLCERISTLASKKGQYYAMLETDFTVLKSDGMACPSFELESIGQTYFDDDLGQTYCAYTVLKTKYGELILKPFMSSGSFGKSEMSPNRRTWYQLEMIRTLTIRQLIIQFAANNEHKEWVDNSKFIKCVFDNVKWSFLHLVSGSCGNKTWTAGPMSTVLFKGKMHARFITLVFEETRDYSPHKFDISTQVTSDLLETCSEDLGMKDGSIKDSHILSSTSVQEYMAHDARPHGNGWCPEESDVKPWILVDLIGVTVVEGLTVWELDKGQGETAAMGESSFFSLFYGTDVKLLSIYNETELEIDNSVPASEGNSFMLLHSIGARYVMLEFASGQGCFKFELHGCRQAGLFSLDCFNRAELFETQAIPSAPGRVKLEAIHTLETCKAMCLASKHCSIVRFDGTCIHYPQNPYALWYFDDSRNQTTLAKLCVDEQTRLFPSIKYANKVSTNVEYVTDNAIVASLGYPFSHGAGYEYKWIIQFQKDRYIRIVFTNISLNIGPEDCNDKLVISENIYSVGKGKKIDYRYNGRSSIVETSYTLLILSFMPCPKLTGTAMRGFRSVISGECDGGNHSTFVVFDKVKTTYCNTNLPPDVIYAEKRTVSVRFKQFKDPTRIYIGNEGFRLRYKIKKHSFTGYIKESHMKVCSDIFRKCYIVLDYNSTWYAANKFCSIFNFDLVSISTRDELNFVIHILRDRWTEHESQYIKDVDPRHEEYFQAHIGLIRNGNKFLWEDDSPRTYNPWKPGHPQDNKNCTKIDFSDYSNQTLISEHCTTEIAMFTLCQSEDYMTLEDESTKKNKEPWECKNDWTRFLSNCYHISTDTSVYQSAHLYCVSQQSQLVEIKSKNENDFLRYEINKLGDGAYAIGIEWTGYKYRWIGSGKSPTFMDTSTGGRPSGRRQCGYIDKSKGWIFEAGFCNKRNRLICKRKGDFAKYADQCEDKGLQTQTINLTYTGRSCHNWNTLANYELTDYNSRFPDTPKPNHADSNCADPGGSGILWCYSSGTTLWEPCVNNILPMVSSEENPGNTESEGHFRCTDEDKVPVSSRCDGVFDCADFSDEKHCSTKTQKMFSNQSVSPVVSSKEEFETNIHFLCGSEEWINILAVCDGVIQCVDASDETNCSDSTGLQQNNSTCEDGSCSQHVCDVTTDYSTYIAEFKETRECTTYEFLCESGQCILFEDICNGVPDCLDKSDENQCANCTDSFFCDGTKCLQSKYFCDKYTDCDDGSDESQCDFPLPSSCRELVLQEGLASGQYKLGKDGMNAFCDFSSMDEKVKLSIHGIEFDIKNNTGYLFTKSQTGDVLNITSRRFQELVYEESNQCVLEIKSSCTLRYAIRDHVDVFYDCPCTIDVYDVVSIYEPDLESLDTRVLEETRYNWNHTKLCDGSKRFDVVRSKYYNLTYRGELQFHGHVLEGIGSREIKAEINCFSEFPHPIEVRTTFNEGDCKPCVYGGDEERCQNNHLENCAEYRCPLHTVKCPGSYCIPLHLVCNSMKDCPDGTDEVECDCSEEERELYFIIEDNPESIESIESNNAMNDLVQHFYSVGSDIRILYFTTETPLQELFDLDHRLLKIRESKFHLSNIAIPKPDCDLYGSLARNLLGGIKFRSNSDRGVIFIENSAESAEVARLMFSNLTMSEYPIFRVFKDTHFNLNSRGKNTYNFVQDIATTKWISLVGLGYRRFNKICKAHSDVPCKRGYRCYSSRQCLPLEEVCDGIPQCIGQEDELFCDLNCPRSCACHGYSIECRSSGLTDSDVMTLSRETRRLDLSANPGIRHITETQKLKFSMMTMLNLSSCEISIINENTFHYLNSLRCLDIGYNKLETLPEFSFRNLRHLVSLNIDGNFELRVVSATAFHGLDNLKSVRISGTKLKRIASYTFGGLTLQFVDISQNEIEEIEDYAFNNTLVDRIDFSGNTIKRFNKHIFDGVVSLNSIRSPAFRFCCIRPCYINEDECYPPRDEFSSCEDLMRHPVLQAVLWLVGLTALLGNVSTIIYRIVFDRDRLKIAYGIFVTNLAAADLLMGVYLMIIAIADVTYRNRYIFVDEQWRNSAWCVTAGVISTVSSEASVLFVCFITLDRLLVIKFPFGTVRITPKNAHVCCIISWIVSFAVALIPVVHTSVFKNKFYSKSGVCVALPLTADKPPGWVYSVCIFIGLNFCTFVVVAIGQLTIFREIRKDTKNEQKTQESRKRDLLVARNLILVATTDFLCWFPIGIMGILALSGVPITGDVYAWTAVFLLPFNSALNPVMYTLSAILVKKSFIPSIGEQQRTDIKKEIGLGIIKYIELHEHSHSEKDVKNLKTVRDMLDDEDELSCHTLLTTSILLAKYMCTLHQSTVCFDRFSQENTYLSVRKRKKSVTVIVDSKISVTNDDQKLQDDVYQFGMILQQLLGLKETTT